MRCGESAGAPLGGKLVPNERESVLSEIVGQLSRNPGSLTEIPSMSEQIVEADLQSLRAGSVAQRTRITPFQDTGTAEGVVQCRRRRLLGPKRIVTEVVRPTLWHRPTVEQRGEHQIHPHEVIDHVSHFPFAARRRIHPLVRADASDQIAHGAARAHKIVDTSSGHPMRLRQARYARPGAFGSAKATNSST